MIRITTLLLVSPLVATGFTIHQDIIRNTALQMSTETSQDINLVVSGNNIDMTPALNDYVEKRIGVPLKKLGGDGIVREVDVLLSVYKNPKVR